MTKMTTVSLKDNRSMEVVPFTCPLEKSVQDELLSLLRTEWQHGDYDWVAAMNGDYAGSLTIVMVVGRMDGGMVGTASAAYAARQPEVAAVGSVLTRKEYRGLGIAARLTEIVTEVSFSAGCKASFLGANIQPDCVYQRAGYTYYNGGVMRALAPQVEDFEKDYYQPGQRLKVRPAEWGDLAGVASLLVRPYEWFAADYGRGLFSGRFITQGRCVSNFGYIYYDILERKGTFMVLTGDSPHRVLGLATITPGSAEAQKQAGILDFLLHENYYSGACALIQQTMAEARSKRMEQVSAYLVERDASKADILLGMGFREIGVLPAQLRHGENIEDVRILHLNLTGGACP